MFVSQRDVAAVLWLWQQCCWLLLLAAVYAYAVTSFPGM